MIATSAPILKELSPVLERPRDNQARADPRPRRRPTAAVGGSGFGDVRRATIDSLGELPTSSERIEHASLVSRAKREAPQADWHATRPLTRPPPPTRAGLGELAVPDTLPRRSRLLRSQ